MSLQDFCIHPTSILLPASEDVAQWPVVACDQYTSQPDYWADVENQVGQKPSTLRLVYPEVYLSSPDMQARIQRIQDTARQYLEDGTLAEAVNGLILSERTMPQGVVRKGLVCAIDLEDYSFDPNTPCKIRPTEGTILERLPVRISIREKIVVETTHIMVLLDDAEKTLIEPLYQQRQSLPVAYSTPLMKNGGSLTGYKIQSQELFTEIAGKLAKLLEKAKEVNPSNPMLYAVGDGNHSLATAKKHWENVKATLSAEEQVNHPARRALIELVNLYDDSLQFEPIHRVLFNVDSADLLSSMSTFFEGQVETEQCADITQMKEKAQQLKQSSSSHILPYITQSTCGVISVKQFNRDIEYDTLQRFLDQYLKDHSESSIDYIHGEDVTVDLSKSDPKNIGFLCPSIDKLKLFKEVTNAVLPRKSFSMGEANEKRYYMECRKIIQ